MDFAHFSINDILECFLFQKNDNNIYVRNLRIYFDGSCSSSGAAIGAPFPHFVPEAHVQSIPGAGFSLRSPTLASAYMSSSLFMGYLGENRFWILLARFVFLIDGT